MRHGRTKQRHDAIAQHLVDRAFIPVHRGHHVLQGRIKELLGGFRVAIAHQLGGALEVGKQHGDLLALAFHGIAGMQDLLGQILGGVGEWWTVLAAGSGRCRVRSGDLGTGPDQDIAPLIDCQALALDEFVLQIFQGCVVELELSPEGTVSQASAPLEHGDRVVEDLLKGHCHSSLCR